MVRVRGTGLPRFYVPGPPAGPGGRAADRGEPGLVDGQLHAARERQTDPGARKQSPGAEEFFGPAGAASGAVVRAGDGGRDGAFGRLRRAAGRGLGACGGRVHGERGRLERRARGDGGGRGLGPGGDADAGVGGGARPGGDAGLREARCGRGRAAGHGRQPGGDVRREDGGQRDAAPGYAAGDGGGAVVERGRGHDVPAGRDGARAAHLRPGGGRDGRAASEARAGRVCRRALGGLRVGHGHGRTGLRVHGCGGRRVRGGGVGGRGLAGAERGDDRRGLGDARGALACAARARGPRVRRGAPHRCGPDGEAGAAGRGCGGGRRVAHGALQRLPGRDVAAGGGRLHGDGGGREPARHGGRALRPDADAHAGQRRGGGRDGDGGLREAGGGPPAAGARRARRGGRLQRPGGGQRDGRSAASERGGARDGAHGRLRPRARCQRAACGGGVHGGRERRGAQPANRDDLEQAGDAHAGGGSGRARDRRAELQRRRRGRHAAAQRGRRRRRGPRLRVVRRGEPHAGAGAGGGERAGGRDGARDLVRRAAGRGLAACAWGVRGAGGQRGAGPGVGVDLWGGGDAHAGGGGDRGPARDGGLRAGAGGRRRAAERPRRRAGGGVLGPGGEQPAHARGRAGGDGGRADLGRRKRQHLRGGRHGPGAAHLRRGGGGDGRAAGEARAGRGRGRALGGVQRRQRRDGAQLRVRAGGGRPVDGGPGGGGELAGDERGHDPGDRADGRDVSRCGAGARGSGSRPGAPRGREPDAGAGARGGGDRGVGAQRDLRPAAGRASREPRLHSDGERRPGFGRRNRRSQGLRPTGAHSHHICADEGLDCDVELREARDGRHVAGARRRARDGEFHRVRGRQPGRSGVFCPSVGDRERAYPLTLGPARRDGACSRRVHRHGGGARAGAGRGRGGDPPGEPRISHAGEAGGRRRDGHGELRPRESGLGRGHGTVGRRHEHEAGAGLHEPVCNKPYRHDAADAGERECVRPPQMGRSNRRSQGRCFQCQRAVYP